MRALCLGLLVVAGAARADQAVVDFAPAALERLTTGRLPTGTTYPVFFGERVTGVAIAPSSITTTGTVTAAQFAGSASTTFDGQSSVADGASAVGFTWDVTADLATAGAIHTKWRDNATTNLAYLDYLGTLYLLGLSGIGTATFDLQSGVASGTTAFTFDATSTLSSGSHSIWRETNTSALMTLSHAGALTLADELVSVSVQTATYRPTSTQTWNALSYVNSGTTAFTLAAANDLASGKWLSGLDNTSTELFYIDYTGRPFFSGLTSFSAATLGFSGTAASGTTTFTFNASNTLSAGNHTTWGENGGAGTLLTLDHSGLLTAAGGVTSTGALTASAGLTVSAADITVNTGNVSVGAGLANQIEMDGAATGNPVSITGTGSDTDVDVNVAPKGAGSLEVESREVAFYGGTGRAKTMICHGSKALSAGTVAIDFTDESCEDFASNPICMCGDTSNTTEGPCSATGEATTGVTLNGTGTDTMMWLCIGAK